MKGVEELVPLVGVGAEQVSLALVQLDLMAVAMLLCSATKAVILVCMSWYHWNSAVIPQSFWVLE